MPFVNLPPSLFDMWQKLTDRVTRLEQSQRFTVPVVDADPTNPRNGDMWLNSTTNTLKIKDSTGTTRTITMV